MSRVGRQPIPVPEGVTVTLDGQRVTVKGPKGELSGSFDPELSIVLEDGELRVSRPTDQPRHRSLHGLTRTLVA
ncbi:MAG: 50S ribosomal protein L6, partial [Gemmatimonadota bacterium]|nr:50S ribosomal protein L6 [Gemmatimonadota bacterium]